MRRRAALLALALAGCPGRPPPAAEPVAPSAGVEVEAPAAVEDPAYDAIYFVLVDRFANGDLTNDAEIDLADPQAFHGGDLRGVIDNLDHIQALGFETVWLSPIFEMRTEKFEGHGAFHGYWVRDLSRVEPRFGDEATLRELADALHARGMRLVLDIVWNHVSFDAPLRSERPDFFHPARPIVDWDDPVELVTHEVHGLPDLAQEQPEVEAFLRERSLAWIASGAGGFRVDAVRHMPLDFQARMAEASRAAGGPDFRLIGEVFDGDPTRLAAAWAGGGFDGVFDFPLRYALIDVLCKGAPVGRLGAVLSADRAYADPNQIVTFLDNHDVARVTTECGGDTEKVAEAVRALAALRGVPTVTWGTEVGLEGAGEPENRADMRFQPHALGDALREALAQRRSHPALVSGRTELLSLSPDWLVLARVTDGEDALVSINTGAPSAWAGLPIPAGVGVSFVDLDVPAPAPRSVLFRASEPDLAVIGTAPELGAWAPSAAVALAPEAEGWAASITVPDRTVLEFKLLRGGEWQPGANRYVFVPPGDEPLVIDVAW